MTCQRAQLVIFFGNNDIFNNRFNNITGIIIGFQVNRAARYLIPWNIHTYIHTCSSVRACAYSISLRERSPFSNFRFVLIYTPYFFIVYTWILVLVNVCTCAIYVLYAYAGSAGVISCNLSICDTSSPHFFRIYIFLNQNNRLNILLYIMQHNCARTYCIRLTQG